MKQMKKVVTIVFAAVIMVTFIAGILVSAQGVPSTPLPYQIAEKRPVLPLGITTAVPTTPDGVVTSTTTAMSADVKATATFPVGTTISNAPVNPFIVTITPPAVLPAVPPAGVSYVGYAYDFGPEGATFDPAIEIAIEFDPAKFEGKTPVIYTFEAGKWVRLDTTIVDNKAIAMVTHFSTFVLFAEEVAPPPITPTSMRLHEHWNFISVPKKLADGNDTFEQVFDTVNTSGHSIYYYNITEGWKAVTTTEEVKPLRGYWIYSANDTVVNLTYDTNPLRTPPTRPLYKGWNAIGFSDITAASANSALASIEKSWAYLLGFDAATQKYESAIINNDDTGGRHDEDNSMYPMKGYWVYVTEDCELAGISV